MSSLDIPGWMQRAECFVRRLNHLPGRWGIQVDVDPPVNRAGAEDFVADLPYTMPPSLLRLYTEGARRFRCRYNWTPDQQALKAVGELIPFQYSLYGGPEFLPWDELPRQLGLGGWDVGGENPTPEQQRANEAMDQMLPFIHVGNGDVVGLQIGDDGGESEVLYFFHEDSDDPISTVAPDLETFLRDWESLYYLGPEIWLLDSFLGEVSGRPSIDPELAARWRRLIDETGT